MSIIFYYSMFKAILFDFDGTLVDSVDASVDWLHEEWFTILNKKVSREEAHAIWYDAHKDHPAKMFSQSIRENLGRAIFSSFQKKTYKALKNAHVRALSNSQTFEGVEELLDSLEQPYAIITQNKGKAVRAYIDSFNTQPELLLSGGRQKKRLKLQEAMRHFGAEPTELCFVTDTLGDIIQSCTLHIPTIGVSYGLHDKATLESQDFPSYLGTRGSPQEVFDTLRLHSSPRVYASLQRSPKVYDSLQKLRSAL